MRHPITTVTAAVCLLSPLIFGAEPLPKVGKGWKAELVVKAPEIEYPTAIVAAPDGTLYLGRDPMDMPGPPTKPIDSVVTIKDGNVRPFATGLWAVMGLELIDDTLFVVHAPYLSAFKDTDGDGKADQRFDLMTGLGPKLPGFSGINDHVASGLRLGIDGYLYIAVGDKGIPKGVGKDGTTISLKGGGVIRIKPDGTGLAIVSTGERNPLSVALTKHDDVFTYGNDDDSKKWLNSLTHHVQGAHFGYPYEFLTAPWRTLPITGGQLGGSGTQGFCYNEDALPTRYHGNLFFCDWGLGVVNRYVIEPKGATFKVTEKETFVEAGDVPDFRPFSLCPSWDGKAIYLVDWGFTGWLAKGPKTGRVYRLTYEGEDKVDAPARPRQFGLEGLDHPSLNVRLAAQRNLTKEGKAGVPGLIAKLNGKGRTEGRIHSLWALDKIDSAPAKQAIANASNDTDPVLRAQAARSLSEMKGLAVRKILLSLLDDANPKVRMEAAIGLGKKGDGSDLPGLMAKLGDPDPFVDWSIRKAIRNQADFYASDRPGSIKFEDALASALLDHRRESALALCDENWNLTVINALAKALAKLPDAEDRSRVISILAGLYRTYPEWTGAWFGTNPLAGTFPAKTVDWDQNSMQAVVAKLTNALGDESPMVRSRVIMAFREMGAQAIPILRGLINKEADPACIVALAELMGTYQDVASVPGLSRLAVAPNPPEVRAAALDALVKIPNRAAQNEVMKAVFDENTPPMLLARLLGPLTRAGELPANDLAGFLEHKDPIVRAACLLALSSSRKITPAVQTSILTSLNETAMEPRKAAIETVAQLRLSVAIPKLIAMATGEDRSEALLALASMPDTRAADLMLGALSDRDPKIREAAETSLLVLRDKVRPMIEEAASSGKLDNNAASSVERLLARYQPIPTWKVVGPFARTTAPLFLNDASIDFSLTHSGTEGRPVKWQDRPSEKATGRLSINEFKEGAGDKGGFGYDTNGSPDMAAFAYAEFTSANSRPAWLRVGSSGSVIVMLNGVQVWTYNNFAGRSYDPASDLVKVRLKAGVNKLVIRSRQGIGNWQFSVQVSEPTNVEVVRSSKGMTPDELRTFAIGATGDPKKGESIFFDTKGIGCVKCHAAAGKGTANIGPDLTGLALKYDKVEIIRSILEPSSRIATGYQPVIIATSDGKVYNGLVRSESDTEIELADAEAKLFKIAKASIEERRVGEVSIMPAGLAEGISPVEFSDLVAYLTSLKSPAASAH